MTRPEDLPGFQWMPGMLGLWEDSRGNTYRPRVDWSSPGRWVDDPTARIDHTDPGSEGCLLRLLGDEAWRVRYVEGAGWEWAQDARVLSGSGSVGVVWHHCDSLGAACIAVANARGCWPGGGV